MEEDSKIIDLLYKREEQALIELSEKYGTACKRIAGNILKNHRDAEECVMIHTLPYGIQYRLKSKSVKGLYIPDYPKYIYCEVP